MNRYFADADRKKLRLSDHVEVGYFEYGEGVPVVMLHGAPDTPGSFRRQVDAFISQGYRLICPHLPGYGYTSPPPNGHFAVTDIARILDDFVAALCPGERVALYGHDWGSIIVETIAAMHWDRKENSYSISCLILGSVPPTGLVLGRVPPLKQVWASRYVIATQFPIEAARLIRAIPHDNPELPVGDPQLENMAELMGRGDTLENCLKYYRYLFNPLYRRHIKGQVQEWRRLRKLRPEMPVLMLHGKDDVYVLGASYKRCEAAYPHPATKFIELDAAHWIHYGLPDQFNHLALGFIEARAFQGQIRR